MTSVIIHLALKGQSQVKSGLKDVADAGQNLGNELEQAGRRGEDGFQRISSIAGGVSVTLKSVSRDGKHAGEEISQGAKNAGQSIEETGRKSTELGKKIWKAAHDGIEGFTGLDISVKGVARSIGSLMNKWDAAKKKLGAGMVAGSIATGATLTSDVKAAGHQQTQLKAIAALSSDEEATATFKAVDNMSTESVYGLDDLVKSAKSLTSDGIFSTRRETAVDDAAAANFDDGVTPYDVAKAIGRLKNEDFGEGFERLRDFGLNRTDLKEQGLKFSDNNQFQGTADEAVEGVTRAIEKKFGGLSKRLSTETLEGALSNLDDAQQRLKVSIGQELVPVITFGARAVTFLTTAFNALPRPFKFCIAWGGVLASAFMGVGGMMLLVGGTISKAIMIYKILSWACGLANTSVLSLAWTVAKYLATSLFAGVGTIMAALALVAVAVAGFYAAMAGSADAATKSAYDLQQSWGFMGSIWVKLGDLLSGINSHPVWGLIARVLDPLNITGAWSSPNSAKDDADDRKLYDLEVKRAKKHGERVKSFEEWKGNANEDEYKAPDPKPKTAPVITNGGTASGTSFNFNIPGSAPTNDIEKLEDILAGSDDKDERKQLREQLRLARRAQKHAKAFEREEAKEEREQEKQRKQAARLSDRQADADADVAEAQLNASLATKLAAMKRAGASKSDMAKVKAQFEMRRAQIRATGEGSDKLGASRALRLGSARAAGMESLSEYADDEFGGGRGKGRGRQSNQQHLNSMLAILRRGGSLQDLNRRGAYGGQEESGERGGTGGSGGGPDNRTLSLKMGTPAYSAGQHTWTIKAEPIIIKDPYGRDAGML